MMWKGKIRQDGIDVVEVFARTKERCKEQLGNYATQYFEEDFSRIIISIKKVKDDDLR